MGANDPLPVVAHFAQTVEREMCSRFHLLLIQHALPDVLAFIATLARLGFSSMKVIAIPYSATDEAVERLRSSGVSVMVPGFDALETSVRSAFHAELADCTRAGKRLLVQEVGGYLADTVCRLAGEQAQACAGIVEETAQGMWRYGSEPSLPIPVLQIADSELKKIESQQVGQAVVDSLANIMTSMGRTLQGRACLVLGYGTIGKAVCRALVSRRALVSAYDIDPLKRLRACFAGFATGGRTALLASAEVIVGATGQQSLTGEDLPNLTDGAVLASASSRQLELPTEELKSQTVNATTLGESVVTYEFKGGKTIYLLKDGFPLNFPDHNVPMDIMDLIHSELLLGLRLLMLEALAPGLHRLPEDLESSVVEQWLAVWKG